MKDRLNGYTGRFRLVLLTVCLLFPAICTCTSSGPDSSTVLVSHTSDMIMLQYEIYRS